MNIHGPLVSFDEFLNGVYLSMLISLTFFIVYASRISPLLSLVSLKIF